MNPSRMRIRVAHDDSIQTGTKLRLKSPYFQENTLAVVRQETLFRSRYREVEIEFLTGGRLLEEATREEKPKIPTFLTSQERGVEESVEEEDAFDVGSESQSESSSLSAPHPQEGRGNRRPSQSDSLLERLGFQVVSEGKKGGTVPVPAKKEEAVTAKRIADKDLQSFVVRLKR